MFVEFDFYEFWRLKMNVEKDVGKVTVGTTKVEAYLRAEGTLMITVDNEYFIEFVPNRNNIDDEDSVEATLPMRLHGPLFDAVEKVYQHHWKITPKNPTVPNYARSLLPSEQAEFEKTVERFAEA